MMSIGPGAYRCLCLCCRCCVSFLCLLCVLRNCGVGKRGERERRVGDNAHVKDHGRCHADSNLTISSYVNLDYLSPSSVDERAHVNKQEEAPNLFSSINVYVHAAFFKLKKICGTVPSAAVFLPITATLQATSQYVTICWSLKNTLTSDKCSPSPPPQNENKETHSETV